MRLRLLGALAALAVLAGCTPSGAASDSGQLITAGTEQTNLIQVGELSRSYIVRAPDDKTAPMPLLIMMHGAGGDASRAERATGFSDDALANDFVVAYPNGTQANLVTGELAWNAGACCGLARDSEIDDESFILAMITELQAAYPIDPERIYLAGFSNGGMMSYRLACDHGELFAGVAVVSGALNYSPCAPAVPLSVLIVHGLLDATVPYNGGETNPTTASRFGQWTNGSVALATEFWRVHDSCDTDAVVTSDEFTSTEAYSGCDADTTLDVVTITDGTHTWPRVDTLGVDGSQLILEFFSLN
jgi:polyhydroxybutyrate depolymerase